MMCSMRERPAAWSLRGVPAQPCNTVPVRHASAPATANGRSENLLLFIGRCLFVRGLPQLHLVAVRIDEPAEPPIFMLFDLTDDLRAAGVNLGERTIQVIDDQVEHEHA